MPEQSFPAMLEAVDDACTWVGIAVRSLKPRRHDLATTAVDSVRGMVESAIRNTPDERHVTVRVTHTTGDLKIEVRNPGRASGGPNSWAKLSSTVREFGSSCTDDGHTAWILLPLAPQAREQVAS